LARQFERPGHLPGTFSSDTHEGITTIPMTSTVWALGWENRGRRRQSRSLVSIDTNGLLPATPFHSGGGYRIISDGENFFGIGAEAVLRKWFGEQRHPSFQGMVGDILVADEGGYGRPSSLYRLRWDGTDFKYYCIGTLPTTDAWEAVNFPHRRPVELPSPIDYVQMHGWVTDDGRFVLHPSIFG